MTSENKKVQLGGWITKQQLRVEMGIDRQKNKDCRSRDRPQASALSQRKQLRLFRQELLRHQRVDPKAVVLVLWGCGPVIAVKKLRIQNK